MSAQPYDPAWVVELARREYPQDVALHRALEACTTVVRYCDCGCGTPYFAEPSAETAGEDSDFGLRVSIPRDDAPPVVVDFLPDGRVACIEA